MNRLPGPELNLFLAFKVTKVPCIWELKKCFWVKNVDLK